MDSLRWLILRIGSRLKISLIPILAGWLSGTACWILWGAFNTLFEPKAQDLINLESGAGWIFSLWHCHRRRDLLGVAADFSSDLLAGT
jgi:hypothetical protein